MTTYKHIVQVYPVENGMPNLSKVVEEFEFDTGHRALQYIKWLNDLDLPETHKAVYLGRVNDTTGELE